MTKQLSPAARAVRDAVLATYADNIPKDDSLWALERASTVAALRAAADQIVIKLAGLGQESAWYLEEIATELEAQ
jgi:hypothetical protein